MLRVTGLEVSYGSIRAVQGIDFDVREGEIVTLIGANGAGKTSTLHALSGLIPSTGSVELEIDGNRHNLRGIAPDLRVGLGLVQVPEGRRVFGNLSVRDNLLLGAYRRKDDLTKDLENVFRLFPRLKERLNQRSSTLSGGEQQMLAIGRALMSRPRILLLDEPSMGLAPLLVREIFRIIQAINAEGVTILLVEQNAHMALKIAQRAFVLETGKIALSGPADELARSETVKRAYLGG